MTERFAGLCVLILTFALAACAGRPEGVLAPVAADSLSPQASTVSMLGRYQPQTVRRSEYTLYRRTQPAAVDDRLGDLDPTEPRFGHRRMAEEAAGRSRETNFAVVRAQNLPSVKEAREWLHLHNRDGHAMVFVHGFNNRYEDSVFRFAQIVHDSGADVTPILFTWPSRANVLRLQLRQGKHQLSRVPRWSGC